MEGVEGRKRMDGGREGDGGKGCRARVGQKERDEEEGREGGRGIDRRGRGVEGPREPGKS